MKWFFITVLTAVFIKFNATYLTSIDSITSAISLLFDMAHHPHSQADRGYQTTPPEHALDYETQQYELELDRQALSSAYHAAENKEQKQAIIEQAREKFVVSLTTLLPYWYGTPWDYNGMSDTPQQGYIACGYYVSTVLRDSSLNVQRNKMAQQPSENIIKSLTTEDYIKRYSETPLDEFIASVDAWGEGVYVVGLDTHVGYIWHDGQHIRFIHSNVTGPRSAYSEPAQTSTTLANSKYRVLGKISADDALIIDWLQGSAIKTKT